MNGEFAERQVGLLNQLFASKENLSAKKKSQISDKADEAFTIDIRFVVARLKKGFRLTNDELVLLKSENKLCYQRAIKIMREREKYRRLLNSCSTKEEASNTHFVKSDEVSKEARGNGKIKFDNQRETEFIQMRISAIINEYADFVKNGKYSNLPWGY